jgi:capsular exopolysaccharide synthesis family protein
MKFSQFSDFSRILLQDCEISDAFEAVFAGLWISSLLESGSSILVASSKPGEGKTIISSGLAITAARASQSVLLIDGDLRRSSLTAAVDSPDAEGLIEVLLGQADAAEVIRPVPAFGDSSNAGRVSFMAGGRKSAGSLAAVDWHKARTLFKSICRPFDVVFLDSPAILAAKDALLLAGVVDTVLLVAGAGSARVEEVRRAKEQLDASGTPIIGVVLNRFEIKLHGRADRPYGGYYQRSSTGTTAPYRI